MADLKELIARLEAAQLGGHELDCEIADAIGYNDGGLVHRTLKPQFQHWRYDTNDPAMWETRRTLPNWSTSLDAALLRDYPEGVPVSPERVEELRQIKQEK